jgi:acyl-CoA thioester hydrolase
MQENPFALENFAHKTQLRVRFRDVDAMQHVHHGVYLVYMENARTDYLRSVIGWAGITDQIGPIIARVEVDYQQPLFLDDEVIVWTRVARLGTKSFDMVYSIQRQVDGQTGVVVATGKTFLVAYNYPNHLTAPVPDDWRTKIIDFEPALSP